MWKFAFALALGFGLIAPAMAAEPCTRNTERQVKIGGMDMDEQACKVALMTQELGQVGSEALALKAKMVLMLQDKALTDAQYQYWQDACQSTPQCGGTQ